MKLKKIFLIGIVLSSMMFIVPSGYSLPTQEVKVEESSMFYESPHDVMAAFDDDDTNYAASTSDSFPVYFIVKLNNEIELNNIEITWYDKNNYAKSFEIYGFNNKGWFLLDKQKDWKMNNEFSSSYPLLLNKPIRVEKIKFIVYETIGQRRLLLRKFVLNSNRAGLVKKTVSDIVNQIPGADNEKKLILINEWIYQNIKPGLTQGEATPEDVLEQRIGACGNNSVLMIAMANELGIEGRIINLWNIPSIGGGHSVVEFFYDGKWHLFDPTNGAYYTNNGVITGDIASFEDIRKNPDIVANHKYLPVGQRLLSNLNKEFINTGFTQGPYSSPLTYSKANPSGVASPDNPMFFPIVLDFKKQKSFHYGSIDGDSSDMQKIGSYPAGLSYLGAARFGNNNHQYMLSNATVGKNYIIEIRWNDFNNNNLAFFADSSGGIIKEGRTWPGNNKWQKLYKIWKVKVTATKPNVILKLKHNYLTEGNFASIDKITVREL